MPARKKTTAVRPLDAARLATQRELGLLDAGYADAYGRIVRLAHAGLGTDGCMFAVAGEAAGTLEFSVGVPAALQVRAERLCLDAIVEMGRRSVTDLRQDRRLREHPAVKSRAGFRFLAGVPVHAPNRLEVGAICALDADPGRRTATLARTLQQAALALEDILLLHSQAVRDPVSGLYNRHYFEDALASEWARAYRHLVPLSVILARIDTPAAPRGARGRTILEDRIMRVGDVLRNAARRAGDVVSRFGVSDFAMLLPEATEPAVRSLMNEIVRELKHVRIPGVKGAAQRIRMAMGAVVVSGPEHLTFGEHYPLLQAEEALQEAIAARGRKSVLRVLAGAEQG